MFSDQEEKALITMFYGEYDDVSNDQRKVIYQQRNEILEATDVVEITVADPPLAALLDRVTARTPFLAKWWEAAKDATPAGTRSTGAPSCVAIDTPAARHAASSSDMAPAKPLLTEQWHTEHAVRPSVPPADPGFSGSTSPVRRCHDFSGP